MAFPVYITGSGEHAGYAAVAMLTPAEVPRLASQNDEDKLKVPYVRVALPPAPKKMAAKDGVHWNFKNKNSPAMVRDLILEAAWDADQLELKAGGGEALKCDTLQKVDLGFRSGKNWRKSTRLLTDVEYCGRAFEAGAKLNSLVLSSTAGQQPPREDDEDTVSDSTPAPSPSPTKKRLRVARSETPRSRVARSLEMPVRATVAVATEDEDEGEDEGEEEGEGEDVLRPTPGVYKELVEAFRGLGQLEAFLRAFT